MKKKRRVVIISKWLLIWQPASDMEMTQLLTQGQSFQRIWFIISRNAPLQIFLEQPCRGGGAYKNNYKRFVVYPLKEAVILGAVPHCLFNCLARIGIWGSSDALPAPDHLENFQTALEIPIHWQSLINLRFGGPPSLVKLVYMSDWNVWMISTPLCQFLSAAGFWIWMWFRGCYVDLAMTKWDWR